MSTVILSGASGFIGSRLVAALRARGDRVVALSRRHASSPDTIHWDAEAGRVDPGALAAVAPDVVVNLAGENIGKRWTAERRRRIHDSRVRGTAALASAVASLAVPPRAFVSGSAVGFYGARRGDEELTEDSAPGQGFLARVVRDWEQAAQPAASVARLVFLRTATVLGPEGGALKALLRVFRLGVGGPVGDGHNWFSWIGAEDLVAAILFLADSASATGAFNLASPQPVRYAEFARTLGRVLSRPAVVTTPAIALELAFGDMARETLLASQRVVPARLDASGFAFRHPDLEAALRAELRR